MAQVLQLRTELSELHRRTARETAELQLRSREESSKATIVDSAKVCAQATAAVCAQLQQLGFTWCVYR